MHNKSYTLSLPFINCRTGKGVIFISLVILLSGCAVSTLNKGLPRLNGKNIELVVSYLGIPDNEQKLLGRHVYTWSTSENFTITTPVTSYNSGTINGVGMPTSYYGSTTSYMPQNVHWFCTIRIITNESNIITGTQHDGNNGGCSQYASSIDNLVNHIEAVESVKPSPTLKQ